MFFINYSFNSIFYKSSSRYNYPQPSSNTKETSSPEPEHNPKPGSGKDPEEDDFVNKTVNNNNLISIEAKHNYHAKHTLDLASLKSSPSSPIYNFLKGRDIVRQSYKNKSGIYLIHNNVNGKQYIGSGTDLGQRLATYYFPSRLSDNRYISNSILKYGHAFFSIVILNDLGITGTIKNSDIISKEQMQIDLYKPALNLNPTAGSSKGFRHTAESKKLMSEFRKGKTLSEEAKKRLSTLFSGELNPFWSKTHSSDTLKRMSLSKLGYLNPMYNKKKSNEFINNMHKDRTGYNNPMFGKAKSEETLAKLRKKIYVYGGNKEFIKYYVSVGSAVKDLRIGASTIKKYLDTGKVYKDKYFYSELQ